MHDMSYVCVYVRVLMNKRKERYLFIGMFVFLDAVYVPVCVLLPNPTK
jgi:hypothetical protein